MTVYAAPNATVEASLQANNSGGVGTYRISIVDTPNGLVFLPPTVTGISERPSGSAIYHWTGQGPANLGSYTIVWDAGEDAGVLAIEELVVQGARAPDVPIRRRRARLFDRLMPERCDIVRFEQIGSEDGTPITAAVTIDSAVPCRVDLTQGKHRDMYMRMASNASRVNYGLAILVADVDVQAGDRMLMVRGPRSGQAYQVFSTETVLGHNDVHHVEAEIRLVEGAI